MRSGGGRKGWSGGGIKRWSGGGIKRRAGLWKRGDGWRGGPLRRRRQPGPARATWRRLSALSVFLRKSICMEYLYGRRALNSRKRWFPARVGSSRGEKVRSVDTPGQHRYLPITACLVPTPRGYGREEYCAKPARCTVDRRPRLVADSDTRSATSHI